MSVSLDSVWSGCEQDGACPQGSGQEVLLSVKVRNLMLLC